jgi:hypothetical protein
MHGNHLLIVTIQQCLQQLPPCSLCAYGTHVREETACAHIAVLDVKHTTGFYVMQ